MAEYIIETDSDYLHDGDGEEFKLRHEETLVRCRNCEHCYSYSTGGYFCATVKQFESTTPDGFCAWGVRKDG